MELAHILGEKLIPSLQNEVLKLGRGRRQDDGRRDDGRLSLLALLAFVSHGDRPLVESLCEPALVEVCESQNIAPNLNPPEHVPGDQVRRERLVAEPSGFRLILR